MSRRKSPFHQRIPDRGSVVAVQLEDNLWCYVRKYFLCHGFLPFFSTDPLPADQLPDLRASVYFDLWCYDTEETPMVVIGSFPFEYEEESYGEPFYTPPDAIDAVYTIHEIQAGLYRMRKTKDEAEVSGMRLQRRYQPHQFSELLCGKTGEWPIIGRTESNVSPG